MADAPGDTPEGAPGDTPDGAAADRALADALRAAYAAWFAALEAGDVARALGAVTADVVHRAPSGATRVGRAALGAALAEFHAAYAERVSWTLDVVSVAGDEARVRVREVATLRPRAGGGPSLRAAGWHDGRLRREADGAWRIAADTSTIDGPPEPVPHAFALPDGVPGDAPAAGERPAG